MNDYITIIRDYMRDNNKTQEDIAKMFGVSISTVSYWLAGKRQLNLKHYLKAAEIFG